MRPLPRVLAFTDDGVAALDDLGIRAAAIAAAGPAVALVARLPAGTTDQLASLATRLAALAAPPMAAVLVTGRADVAHAVGASGVILRGGDLSVAAARLVWRGAPPPVVLRSVHALVEARQAVADGADALIVGTIWPSASHPGRPAAGTSLLREVVALGLPTYAIGGVTPERAIEARRAGAWGVAAIAAVWHAERPYQLTRRLARTWAEDSG